MRRRGFIAVAWTVAAALALPPAAAAMDEVERARIDRLLMFIANQKDARFIRNGSAYSGRDAAKFLRGKFDKMGEHVSTAQQFIDQIAARSSTTGQPYLMRFADGSTRPVSQVLGEELARMDKS